jgi:hypothetical protein
MLLSVVPPCTKNTKINRWTTFSTQIQITEENYNWSSILPLSQLCCASKHTVDYKLFMPLKVGKFVCFWIHANWILCLLYRICNESLIFTPFKFEFAKIKRSQKFHGLQHFISWDQVIRARLMQSITTRTPDSLPWVKSGQDTDLSSHQSIRFPIFPWENVILLVILVVHFCLYSPIWATRREFCLIPALWS